MISTFTWLPICRTMIQIHDSIDSNEPSNSMVPFPIPHNLTLDFISNMPNSTFIRWRNILRQSKTEWEIVNSWWQLGTIVNRYFVVKISLMGTECIPFGFSFTISCYLSFFGPTNTSFSFKTYLKWNKNKNSSNLCTYILFLLVLRFWNRYVNRRKCKSIQQQSG